MDNISGRRPRPVEERNFSTHDGTRLFFRYWPAINPSADARAIVIFHRGHEHSGRVTHIVDEIDLPGYAFFAWDARGHGRSPGERGFSPSLGTSVRDIHVFVRYIISEFGIAEENLAVVAQSVGAVLTATWVHDYAPRIRAMVLASPAFKVRLYAPFARTGLALWRRLRGHFFVNSYVKAHYLTHDPARIESYNRDPLISRPISVDILLSLYITAERIVADAAAITVPTQLLISGSDWVVHKRPQLQFFEHLGSLIKEKHELSGFFHDTLGEKDRVIALTHAREFIEQAFAVPYARPDLRNADVVGFTAAERDRLATPLPVFSPRGLYWSMVRLGLRLGASVSEGIRIGRKIGFDSGSMLDYVYRNTPSGRSAIGRLIDKQYLNAIGWSGIRQRKAHLEETIGIAVRQLRAAGQSVHIVDIAAGHGRYVLDALSHLTPPADSITLRDYSEVNVAEGRRLIAARGMERTAQFVQADAFDEQNLAALLPPPSVVIVSGLWELFSENALINRSLAGIARAMPAGSYLVYTGQPWHPQLEFIARALTSHRQGQPWVMRRRNQEELDQLVQRAGFGKVDQRIDEWGIFTVSLAQRR